MNNVFPLDRVGEYVEAQIENLKAPKAPPQTMPADKPDPEDDTPDPTAEEVKAAIAEMERRWSEHTATVAELTAKAAASEERAQNTEAKRLEAEADAVEAKRKLNEAEALIKGLDADRAALGAMIEQQEASLTRTAAESAATEQARAILADQKLEAEERLVALQSDLEVKQAALEALEANAAEAARQATEAAEARNAAILQATEANLRAETAARELEQRDAVIGELRLHLTDTAELRAALTKLESEKAAEADARAQAEAQRAQLAETVTAITAKAEAAEAVVVEIRGSRIQDRYFVEIAESNQNF
jgi:fused signal recognition particle receptor